MGYFLKNLDQQNINNAFLSGMEEDLGMYQNQLVTAVSIWTVGYVVGQIPSNMLLTRVSARWVIPSVSLKRVAADSTKRIYAARTRLEHCHSRHL